MLFFRTLSQANWNSVEELVDLMKIRLKATNNKSATKYLMNGYLMNEAYEYMSIL